MPVHYGTSSFSEKSWVGPFYPEGTAPTDFLREYARHFQAVEVDVTYYRVPDDRLVDGWNEKTPDDFVICAKFPRSIVHGGEGARPDPERLLVPEVVDEDLRQFLSSMGRLGGKCGPLVLQFPYFNRATFPNAGPFLERLDAFLARLPDRFRYAVELRNKTWVHGPLVEMLQQHGVALVLVDLAYMPHADHYLRRLDVATADFSYVRLIGDRAAVEDKTDAFDRIVVDRTDRLRRWGEVIRRLLERVPEVFAFANNHYAGHGPATIRQLRQEVERA